MIKNILHILFFLTILTRVCYGNMASPITEGTLAGSPLTSSDINILNEKIYIKAIDYQNAKFVIDYKIKTDKSGTQIPLLFYAKDFKDNFNVWVDGISVNLQQIPDELISTKDTKFQNFSESFNRENKNENESGNSESVMIYWDKNYGIRYNLNDLKYFELDLSEGEHSIRVEYVAFARSDRSGWVKDYSVLYSLYPAKFWKSFGTLEIIFDAENLKTEVTTNLGNPSNGNLSGVAIWNFDKLPSEYIKINYTPPISEFANLLIAIDPIGITLIFAILLVAVHLILIFYRRKKNPSQKIPWIVIIGSLIIPFLILYIYIMSFEIIDSAIGIEAGNYHGYTILSMALYPIFMPVYFILMFLLDYFLKKSFLKIKEQKNLN